MFGGEREGAKMAAAGAPNSRVQVRVGLGGYWLEWVGAAGPVRE